MHIMNSCIVSKQDTCKHKSQTNLILSIGLPIFFNQVQQNVTETRVEG